jgi:hypothetical protein
MDMSFHGSVLRGFGAAFVFTSLLAASAVTADAATFTPLTLQNGWTNAPYGTRNAGVALVSEIVQFDGAIASGSGVAFTLPVGLRPSTNVYVPVDLCNATKGRLFIQPDGTVTVQAENNTLSNAQCFTSLEGASFALSSAGFTSLTLQNGWTNAPYGTSNAAVEWIDGIVHFKGAIASGTSPVLATLPFDLRPSTNVYVPVDLCNAAKGRLFIQPDGTITVQAERSFSDAQCFTSLEGASFAQRDDASFAVNGSGFTRLGLQSGWTNALFGTGNAAADELHGIVHLKGAIASGWASPFTLPSGMRPEAIVYAAVDMCGSTNGRLIISPDGTVSVQAESSFANAQCFTSLDGVSFAAANFTPLALQNGWTAAPYGTTVPASAIVDGIVYLKGAIANGWGSPFTLPVGQRPATDVYVPVDLCNATKGRLAISGSTGAVTVQAENGTFSNAQCFTSLDGASFAPSAAGFTALTLQNGWTNAPYSTSNAAVENIGGVVHFKGAIASGSGSPFTLPAGLAPAQDVYVSVDLCGATNGRLMIGAGTGVVTVQAENGALSNAQCFTSLDGASFVLSQSGSFALLPTDGWSDAPFYTGAAATMDLSGIVHLSGAVAGAGAGSFVSIVPAVLIPANDVYVPVDLCNATKGRLVISGGTGLVSVQAENGAFSNAECFTSLEGAFYSL